MAYFAYFSLCYMRICDIVYGCSETNQIMICSEPLTVHHEREVLIR